MRTEKYEMQHIIKEKSLNARKILIMCTGETIILIES